MKAGLKSSNPDVGYMMSGDLTLTNDVKYHKVNDTVTEMADATTRTLAGTVHFPAYTELDDATKDSLKKKIYDLLETRAKKQETFDNLFAVINRGKEGTLVLPPAGEQAVPKALKNDLTQGHKDLIDEYIAKEDIFGYINGES